MTRHWRGPHRYVVTGRTRLGEEAPVAVRFTSWDPQSDAPSTVCAQLVEGARWYFDNEDSLGRQVEQEPIFELPDDLLELWMVKHLARVLPSAERAAFNSWASIVLNRLWALREGRIAERGAEPVSAVLRSDDDIVVDLVFSRGRPAIYSRVDGEWVRSEGVDGADYQSFRLVRVHPAVVDTYDECRRSGKRPRLGELRTMEAIAVIGNEQEDD